ncbi:MAG TPA: hypothetical protein PKW94_00890 [Candidatus Dojkabacteria bacterium]|nr:hypothetical protein [Candidatus Dojkabacteria bacterium]HQI92639.1 hypothetical protein [Candidatus Dojkabacteria bacterium]
MGENFVLKIGGSVMYDNSLNVNEALLAKVKNWYMNERKNYKKVAMVVGGGSLSRDMQEKISSSVGGEESLHNIAMSVTQTNAAILQGYLEDMDIFLPKKLGDAYEFLMEENQKTLLSGGLKIGWSTDMDAAIYADILGVKTVYKISNVEFLYEADPKTEINTKPILDISWEEYFKLFNIVDGDNHVVNESIPIDVNCAQFCAKKGISFFLCGGKYIQEKESVQEILKAGTLIHP